MQELPIILNPASSSGKAGRLKGRLEQGLGRRGVAYRILETRAPGHAAELAVQAHGEGATRLVVMGGDGTIHEVTNGLLAQAGAGGLPEIGVIPVGTGNDFFRMVGVPSRLDDALSVVLDGRAHAFDVGHCRWQGGESHFVNLLGVGLDVAVLQSRDGFRKLSGKLQYLAAAIHTLTRFSPIDLRIHVGEESDPEAEEFVGPALMAQVTVGPSVGGGILVNPGARADDGLLDLFLIRPVTALQVARYLPRVLRGTHGAEDEIELRQLRRVRIEAGGQGTLAFEMDGELVGHDTPWLEVRVIPGALPILLPASDGGATVRDEVAA
jgi:diacylglycerol kinase (ATP)